MGEAGSVVLGGADCVEITRVRVEGGETVVWVQTPDAQRVLCGACGARARSKGRREVRWRDAPGPGGAGCEVRWRKRIWWCPNAGCETRTWTEECELAAPRRVLTCRAEQWAAARLEAVEGSVASTARRLGVAWATVWSAVAAWACQVVGDPGRVGPVARLGLDETVMRSASRLARRRYVSAAVDAATGQVIDIFDGRNAADLHRWLEQQPAGWLAAIEVVCCDPHEGYRSGITRARRDTHLSDSVKIAADAFHIVRLANQALDGARRRVQNETTGHRGRKGDPLYHARKLLLMGAERLDAAGWDKMLAALDAADPVGAENAVVGVDLQRCQPIVARRDDRLRRVRGVDAVHLDLHAPSGSLDRQDLATARFVGLWERVIMGHVIIPVSVSGRQQPLNRRHIWCSLATFQSPVLEEREHRSLPGVLHPLGSEQSYRHRGCCGALGA